MAIITAVRGELEKERLANGARLADAERKFMQLQRHTRTLLAEKEKAVKEVLEAGIKQAEAEAARAKAEEGLKQVRERVAAAENEAAQHKQRAAAAVVKAQEAALHAQADADTLRLEVESCRTVLRNVERDLAETSLARDIAANERTQLVLQLELLLLMCEASEELPSPLLRLAQEHFALQREQAALQARHEVTTKEAERMRRELVRLARHVRVPSASSLTAATTVATTTEVPSKV